MSVRRTSLTAATVVGAALGLTVAGSPLAAAPADTSDTEAAALLEQAYLAAHSVSYQGVQYVSAWNDDGATSLVVNVAHVPRTGLYVQVWPTPSADSIRTLERDDTAVASTLPGLAAQPLLLLRRNYDLRVGAVSSVTGRPAVQVEAWRPDGTLAAQFWLDQRTRLVLRRELYDRQSRLVRASAYVSITIGRAEVPMTVVTAVPNAPGTRLTADQVGAMKNAKWHAPRVLDGSLTLYDARMTNGRVLHLSYSDGLSTVSLFEQRGRLDHGQLASWREQHIKGSTVYRQGVLPERIVWSSRGIVYTMVADAPAGVAAAVVAQLPHGRDRDDNGFFARLGRGFKRLGSWLNPFD